MSAPPYMKFYTGDYDRDTGHLRGPAEHGAYFMLLKAMWNAGGKLPADDARLARLVQCSDAEWAEIKPVVMPFFTRRGGVIRHKRIDRELANYADTSVRASKAGKLSASKRANKNNKLCLTSVQRAFNQSESEPEPDERNNRVPFIIKGSNDGNRPDVRRTTTDNRRSAWADAIAERNRAIAGDDEPQTGGSGDGGPDGEGNLRLAYGRQA